MVFNPRYAVAYHPKGYFDPTRVGGNNAQLSIIPTDPGRVEIPLGVICDSISGVKNHAHDEHYSHRAW